MTTTTVGVRPIVGVELKPLTLRVTQTDRYGELGASLVRRAGLLRRRYKLQVTPVIEMGKTINDPPDEVREKTGAPLFASYRSPDTFNHFEFGLKESLRLSDKKLSAILESPCVLEYWTNLTEYAEVSDDTWIRWFFPYTTWERSGRGRYTGVSHESPFKVTIPFEDIPDPTQLNNGGYWKTKTPPPS